LDIQVIGALNTQSSVITSERPWFQDLRSIQHAVEGIERNSSQPLKFQEKEFGYEKVLLYSRAHMSGADSGLGFEFSLRTGDQRGV
jgi:hypothetical protein